MAKYSKQDRKTLIEWFPVLADDSHFEITSDCTPAYNCIGWALGMNDVWVGLYHPSQFAWSWWPQGVPCDEKQESLIALFEYFGFEQTTIDDIEDGYDKVALYSNAEGWTHAARVIGNNVLHSKIGTAWDIHHSGGNIFAATEYGNIFAYMKRPIANRYISDLMKPKIGKVIISEDIE